MSVPGDGSAQEEALLLHAGNGDGPSAELADLERVADVSLSYLSVEDLLSELLERIRSILNADTAAILLLDRERGALLARAARGIEEEVREGVEIPLGRGFAGRIAAECRPIAIEDVDHADVLNPLLRRRGIVSLLGVPLIVQGEVIGVLHVGTLKRRTFLERDARLLQLAADRAALAVSNVQLVEQRSVTELMQRVLLPSALPSIPGLRLSAKYRPGDTGLKVGGDWYDVFLLPGARIALVIGDVVGRGIHAAAAMAEIRAAARAYALVEPDPVVAMSRLNELVCSLGHGRTATMALYTLDLETERVRGCSAGHLPAILRDAEDGTPRLLPGASGPPLGAVAGARYLPIETLLVPGSSLLMFTDGLVERRGEPLELALARLTATVGAAGDELLPLADAVFARDPPSTEIEDDVAVLAIEMLPVEDVLQLQFTGAPGVLAVLRRGIAHWLSRHGVDERTRYDVTLAASEAAANAITHAYGARDPMLELECAIDGEEIVIVVRDTGRWRPASTHSGIGLTVMNKLMDTTDVHRSQAGTTVTLRKRMATANA